MLTNQGGGKRRAGIQGLEVRGLRTVLFATSEMGDNNATIDAASAGGRVIRGGHTRHFRLAFSQQSTGPGDGNSSFADPDDQITNSFGLRPLDLNEQSKLGSVQQQGTFDPLWWEQSLHG